MTLAHAGATLLFDAELVTYRLEEAGATLLALPGTGWSTRLRASSLEIVRAAVESYGWSEKHIRPPIPSAARITRMDDDSRLIELVGHGGDWATRLSSRHRAISAAAWSSTTSTSASGRTR